MVCTAVSNNNSLHFTFLHFIKFDHTQSTTSASLEAQLANAIEARTIEYNTVKQSAMRALDNEFETLRLAMRIKLSSEK